MRIYEYVPPPPQLSIFRGRSDSERGTNSFCKLFQQVTSLQMTSFDKSDFHKLVASQ